MMREYADYSMKFEFDRPRGLDELLKMLDMVVRPSRSSFVPLICLYNSLKENFGACVDDSVAAMLGESSRGGEGNFRYAMRNIYELSCKYNVKGNEINGYALNLDNVALNDYKQKHIRMLGDFVTGKVSLFEWETGKQFYIKRIYDNLHRNHSYELTQILDHIGFPAFLDCEWVRFKYAIENYGDLAQRFAVDANNSTMACAAYRESTAELHRMLGMKLRKSGCGNAVALNDLFAEMQRAFGDYFDEVVRGAYNELAEEHQCLCLSLVGKKFNHVMQHDPGLRGNFKVDRGVLRGYALDEYSKSYAAYRKQRIAELGDFIEQNVDCYGWRNGHRIKIANVYSHLCRVKNCRLNYSLHEILAKTPFYHACMSDEAKFEWALTNYGDLRDRFFVDTENKTMASVKPDWWKQPEPLATAEFRDGEVKAKADAELNKMGDKLNADREDCGNTVVFTEKPGIEFVWLECGYKAVIRRNNYDIGSIEIETTCPAQPVAMKTRAFATGRVILHGKAGDRFHDENLPALRRYLEDVARRMYKACEKT